MRSGKLVLAQALAFPREPGEDRIAVFEHEGIVIVVVADGAGGISGGARAAELLVARIREAVVAPAFEPLRAETWAGVLAHADVLLEADREAGETTGVVLAVAGNAVAGGSSGDSSAWVVDPEGRIEDLTARQHRKLRLGSGRARPVSFSRPRLGGTLVVATDGLFGYAQPQKIAAVALQEDVDQAARDLIQLVRLPGGGLQDDVGVVLVRAG